MPVLLMAAGLTLAACGRGLGAGGQGVGDAGAASASTSSTSASDATTIQPLTITTFTSAGTQISGTPQVVVGDYLTLTALVVDSTGTPVVGTLVTLQASTSSVSLTPSSGGQTTDSHGTASFRVLAVNSTIANVTLTLSATVDGVLQTQTQTLVVKADSTST